MTQPITINRDALKAARERAGLTQQELARLVGVAGGERVSMWELGTATPRVETLARLAAVLGLEIRTLLPRERDPSDFRRLRLLAGLTTTTLARRSDTSPTTIGRWDTGDLLRIPNRADLEPVAKVLKVTVEELERALVRSRAVARSMRPSQNDD